jgi:hypothetical protein
VQYALGFVEGVSATDRFCFEPNNEESCLSKPLNFLEVRNTEEMDVYMASGIFGLAPDSFDPVVWGFIN